MRILWFRAGNQSACFNGPIEQEVERILGKENVIFVSFTNFPPYVVRSTKYRTYFSPIQEAGEFESEKVFPLIDTSLRSGYEQLIREVEPDVIIIDRITSEKEDFGFPEIPKVSFLTDAHSEFQNKLLRAKAHQLDFIFTRIYGGGIGYRIKKDMGIDVGFLPFYAPKEFKDLELERSGDIFLSGCMSEAYPFRQAILYGNTNLSFFNEGIFTKLPMNEYIDNLNKYKILATCGGIFRYNVAKLFEGMTCGILLAMEMPVDSQALRFEARVNCIELTLLNFKEQLKYYLEHEDERKMIAKNGCDLIRQYHTTTARAEQMLAQLEEVINSKKEGRHFDYTRVKGEAGKQLEIVNRRENEFDPNSLLQRAFNNQKDFQSSYSHIEEFWEGYWIKAYRIKSLYYGSSMTMEDYKKYYDQYYDRIA